MFLYRPILALATLILLATSISAQTELGKIQGYVERGGLVVKTSPTTSYKVQQSFPLSTVTIYVAGTTTLSPIFSDSAGTVVKSNPFTADSNAYFALYAADGCYDIKFSGTGISSPFTIPGVCTGGTSSGGSGTIFIPSCSGVNDTTEFSDLITSIGSTKATIAIPYNSSSISRCALNSLTIPSNITLDNINGIGIKVNTGQTLTIQGAILNPEGNQIFFNSLSGQGTVSFSGNRKVSRFYPEWWGAIVDDSTDDTTAIQATIVAADTKLRATVELSDGTYNITNLILTPGNAQHFVSLIGQHTYKTILQTNITSGVALTLYSTFGVRLRDFTLVNSSVSRGTSYGVACDGPNSSGTQVTNGIVEHVTIDGFSIDWSTSSAVDSSTSSEFTYINLDLRNADTGFFNANFNGLNHNFHNLGISDCTIGVNGATAGIYIHSGAASRNNIDFNFSSGGTFNLENFRSETWRTNVLVFAGSPAIHIRNLDVNPNYTKVFDPGNPAGDEAVAIKLNGGALSIVGSYIQGRIQVTGGEIAIKDSQVTDIITNAPFFADFAVQGITYTLENVTVGSAKWHRKGIFAAGFPSDQLGLKGDINAFDVEYGTTFPAKVKRVCIIYNCIYTGTRTLGGNVGDTVLIGSINQSFNGRYRQSNNNIQEFLLKVKDNLYTGNSGNAIKNYYLILSANDLLAFSPIYNTWREVATINGTTFATNQSYALDVYVDVGQVLNLRLRRVGAAGSNADIDFQLEVYNPSNTLVEATTAGTGGTVSGIIANRVSSKVISFTANNATPDIRYGNNFKTANASATTITAFSNCEDGQAFNVIVKDANTTFQNNANIVTGTGADIAATNGYVYGFICEGSVARRIQ